MSGTDYSHEHLQYFNRDLETSLKMINLLIEEIREFPEEIIGNTKDIITNKCERIFISHSSKDKAVVEELIDIFETIGVSSSQIFCSSFDGYGIPLGEDFLKKIKEEISGNVLVVFAISNNFNDSPVCLCEMGAAWVLSKVNIPIIIPPATYDDMKGVFPLSQGMSINDELKLKLLREQIIEMFELVDQSASIWERKRDRIISRINDKIRV